MTVASIVLGLAYLGGEISVSEIRLTFAILSVVALLISLLFVRIGATKKAILLTSVAGICVLAFRLVSA